MNGEMFILGCKIILLYELPTPQTIWAGVCRQKNRRLMSMVPFCLEAGHVHGISIIYEHIFG